MLTLTSNGCFVSRYGQFEVKTVSRVELSQDITVRELRLTHQERQETRKVMHYHYHAWPDHGVPTATDPLRQLSALLRSTKGNGTPVVHCSAGKLAGWGSGGQAL